MIAWRHQRGRVLQPDPPRLRPGRTLPLPHLPARPTRKSSMHTVEVGACRQRPCAAAGAAPPDEPFVPYRFRAAGGMPPSASSAASTSPFTGSSRPSRSTTEGPGQVGRLNEHLRRKIEDHRDENRTCAPTWNRSHQPCASLASTYSPARRRLIREAQQTGRSPRWRPRRSTACLSGHPGPRSWSGAATAQVVIRELNPGRVSPGDQAHRVPVGRTRPATLRESAWASTGWTAGTTLRGPIPGGHMGLSCARAYRLRPAAAGLILNHLNTALVSSACRSGSSS